MSIKSPCRLRLFSWMAVAMAVLALASVGAAQETPRFEGTSLPLPPGQSDPWSAPQSELPPEAVAAITTLFDEGLADPRGCEYREIGIVTGSCWGGDSVTKTHGWIIPSTGKQAFAVGWNGLVYPVVSVGAPADLRADVQALLEKDQTQIAEERDHFDQTEKQQEDQAIRQGKEYHHTEWPLRWNTTVVPEATNVASGSIRPIKAALLLRVGETEWAGKVWSQWFGVQLQREVTDPYLTLATDWAWARFDRAVCAHMRGDDGLALADAQSLTSLQSVIEAEAAKRQAALPHHGGARQDALLSFLEPLPGLLTDEQRRPREPAYTPILKMTHPPKGKEYIEGLIRDLELADARQMSQPGGVNLADDRRVAALIEAGDAAVEPLLDCLENDTRLTRSVRFGRDFSSYRTILGVPEAAYAALASILQTDFFGVGSTADSLTAHGLEGRRQVASAIRAYWQKNKGSSLVDRWYQTLGDDKSAPQQWLEAADNIVQDADVQTTRSSMFGGSWTTTPRRPPGTVPAMRGEPLRARVAPGVSDLLIKRIQELNAPMKQYPDTNLQTKTRMAFALAKWDGTNQLDTLRAVSDDLKTRMAASTPGQMYLVQDLVSLYQARIKVGDTQVLADYAAWLPTVSRERLEFSVPTLFRLMWEHPADPSIRQTAEKLFVDKGSPWVPLINQHPGWVGDLFTSPLIGLEAFRAELLRGLVDPSPAGSATLDAKGNVSMAVDGGWQGGGGVYSGDPLAPAAGSLVHFRVCDLYAYEISGVEGAPGCPLYWPEKNRDEATAACAQFLRRYGDLYQYQPEDRDEWAGREKAHIHFARLDHPATPEDAGQGRAIFALDGERRVWKMPDFPMPASWTTLKDNPSLTNEIDADGKMTTRVDYLTAGNVFQAEEVLVDGKWERFFGFVGPHHMARVPAAEIEFPSDTMSTLSHGFECQALAPGKTEQNGNVTLTALGPDSPLSVTLKLRNRSGLDQGLPGTVLRPKGDDKSLPHAVRLKVDFAGKTATDFYRVPASEWQAVPLKAGVAIAGAQPDGPVLTPTEEFTVMTVNLRDFFDLPEPGMYRLQASFDDGGRLMGRSNPEEFTIVSKRDSSD